MKLTELIKLLEHIEMNHGDVDVVLTTHDGDIFDVSRIEIYKFGSQVVVEIS